MLGTLKEQLHLLKTSSNSTNSRNTDCCMDLNQFRGYTYSVRGCGGPGQSKFSFMLKIVFRHRNASGNGKEMISLDIAFYKYFLV